MPVTDWLLDSDPSIRWQVMRDITHEPADVAAAERSRVASEGGGAQLLGLQAPDGQWGGGTYFPPWTSTTSTLLLLRDMGLDPASEEAHRAVALVRDNSRWEEGDQPYFTGEVEPCINGMAVALGSYFGQDVQGVVDRLLGEQLSDGGWNCEAERGSTRSSFHTTICVLDGLLEHELTAGGSAAVTAARLAGEEYLLERRMFRRLSTGAVVDPAWTFFSFPTRWYYDVLRGSTTSAVPAPHRTSDAPKRSTWSRPSGTWTGDGSWRNPIPVRSTSTWRRERGRPAVGTPCARCGYWTGTAGSPGSEGAQDRV